MGLGRPTDLLRLKFSNPLEQLSWDNVMLTKAIERLKAKSSGKDETDEDRIAKMKRLRSSNQ